MNATPNWARTKSIVIWDFAFLPLAWALEQVRTLSVENQTRAPSWVCLHAKGTVPFSVCEVEHPNSSSPGRSDIQTILSVSFSKSTAEVVIDLQEKNLRMSEGERARWRQSMVGVLTGIRPTSSIRPANLSPSFEDLLQTPPTWPCHERLAQAAFTFSKWAGRLSSGERIPSSVRVFSTDDEFIIFYFLFYYIISFKRIMVR